jgi:hypothetical protein
MNNRPTVVSVAASALAASGLGIFKSRVVVPGAQNRRVTSARAITSPRTTASRATVFGSTFSFTKIVRPFACSGDNLIDQKIPIEETPL